MRSTRDWTATTLAAAVLLMLGACSDSNAPGDDALGSIESDDVALAEVDELEQSVASFSLGGSVSGSLELDGGGIGPGATCAEVSGGGDDSDGDGTPDEATFTFALPACSFTGFRGGVLEITGVIVLSDPTPTSADFSWQVDLDDFQWAFTALNTTRSYTAVRNGTRLLTGDATGVTLSNTVTVVRTFAGRRETSVEHDLLVTFTPETGATLERGEPLPDGTIEKSGTLVWSRDGVSRSFTVETVAPLVWDSSCDAAWKVVSGEVRYTLPAGGYVRVVWDGCGQAPTRSFVPAA